MNKPLNSLTQSHEFLVGICNRTDDKALNASGG